MEAAGGTLLVLGAVCLIAAIVGGNVSLPGGTTFGALTSKGVRSFLGFIAIAFFVIGFVFLLAGNFQPSPIDPQGGTSKSEEIRKVNLICDKNARALQQRQAPEAEAPYAEWASYIEQYVTSWDNTLSQLRSIDVSDGEVSAALAGLPPYVEALAALSRAYVQEDGAAASAADKRRSDAAAEFNRLARPAGLAGCIIRQQ